MLDITQHLGLAAAYASRHCRLYRCEYYETLSLAYEALMRAARTFDPDKGKFSTYYYYWARKMCLRGYLKKQSAEIQDIAAPEPAPVIDDIPLHVVNTRARAVLYLTIVDGRTLRQVGELLGVSHTYVAKIRKEALERIRNEILENDRDGSWSYSNRRRHGNYCAA